MPTRLWTLAPSFPPASARNDLRELATELEVGSGDLGLPTGLDVEWLGVAGYALTYDGVTVLIDPYVSRLGLGDLIRRRVVAPSVPLIDRWVRRADAVLVGHTHFDHALDVPAIARRDGCPVYGSASAVTLMGLHGLADQVTEVVPHRPFEIGPFEVTFVPSAHARLLLGRTPMDGEITCDHVDRLTPQAYRCGQVWGIHVRVAGVQIYHQGSADLIDDEIRHRDVDLFLCGIAGRQATPDYLERILPKLRPRTIVIGHHDNFLQPLAEGPSLAFGVRATRFPDEVAAVDRGIRVAALASPLPWRSPASSNA